MGSLKSISYQIAAMLAVLITKTVAAAGSGAVPVPASGNISAPPTTLSGEELLLRLADIP